MLDTCGTLGGILVMWDVDLMELMETIEGVYAISCKFTNKFDIDFGASLGFMD